MRPILSKVAHLEQLSASLIGFKRGTKQGLLHDAMISCHLRRHSGRTERDFRQIRPMTNTKTLIEEERETSGGTLAVILICIGIIWFGFKWLNVSMEAVNALFSGLAFATLIFTVFLQRRELQLQRQELAETRRELERSASAQEASEAALRAQAEASALTATLSATHTLLTYYREAIGEFNQRSLQLEPDTPHKIAFLEKKQAPLFAILEETYQRITKEHAARRQTNSDTPTLPPAPEN